MNKEQILSAIRSLAQSQGFYGRLLAHIEENPSYLDFLESMKFTDTIDMVLYFES